MKITAVIMAGGRGERFWPLSRMNCPKQFLSLTDDGRTMLRQTADRLLPLVPFDDMFVVANREYRDLIKKQLPQLPAENILSEPVPKSTAPCIGLASAVIGKKYTDAIMLVIPSDHMIGNCDQFIHTLKTAVQAAKGGGRLVTIGITPASPETGYGYILFDPEKDAGQCGVFPVRRFVEKPDKKRAEEYLASGRYLWNSGMFVFRTSVILESIRQYLPDLHQGLLVIRDAYETEQFEKVLEECYSEFRAESIDYGIMERADNIFTVPGDFGWDDAGSFPALQRIHKPDECGNIIRGDAVTVETGNSIIIGGKRLIAAVGLSDIVIVDTDDALLVCDQSRAQDVKKVVESLKHGGRYELI